MHERFRRGGPRDARPTRDARRRLTLPLVSSSPAHDENRRSLYHEPQQRRALRGSRLPPAARRWGHAPQFTFGTFSPEGVRRIPPRRSFRVSRGSHACRPRPAARSTRRARRARPDGSRVSPDSRRSRRFESPRHRRDRDDRSLLGLFSFRFSPPPPDRLSNPTTSQPGVPPAHPRPTVRTARRRPPRPAALRRVRACAGRAAVRRRARRPPRADAQRRARCSSGRPVGSGPAGNGRAAGRHAPQRHAVRLSRRHGPGRRCLLASCPGPRCARAAGGFAMGGPGSPFGGPGAPVRPRPAPACRPRGSR